MIPWRVIILYTWPGLAILGGVLRFTDGLGTAT